METNHHLTAFIIPRDFSSKIGSARLVYFKERKESLNELPTEHKCQTDASGDTIMVGQEKSSIAKPGTNGLFFSPGLVNAFCLCGNLKRVQKATKPVTIDFAALPDGLLKFGDIADENSKDTSRSKNDAKAGKYNKGDNRYGEGVLSQSHVPKENNRNQKQSHYHSPRTITVSPAHSLHMPLMHIFPEVIAIAGKERLLGASDTSRKLAQMAVRGLLTWSDLNEDMQSDDDHDSDYDADDEKSTCLEYKFSGLDFTYETDNEESDDSVVDSGQDGQGSGYENDDTSDNDDRASDVAAQNKK